MHRRLQVCLAVALSLTMNLAAARADRATARRLLDEAERLVALGALDVALARIDEAVLEAPDLLELYTVGAPLWLRAGRLPELIAHLERATLRHPDYAFGWYTLGYAYRRVGRYEHAVLAYESYVQLRPREAEGYFGLAMAARAAGDQRIARRALRRYLGLENDPARAEYVTAARQALLALGATPLPSGAPAAFVRAAELLDEDEPAQADAVLERADVVSVADAVLRAQLRATAAERLGEVAAARAHLELALLLAPLDAAVHAQLEALGSR